MNKENRKPRIYTVATTHLDTTWSWDLETTLRDYLPKTLTENFELFEKYPEYIFSFEGSYRYELMEEYYPELFEKMKNYIAQGRWNVAGSAYENGDVNLPSPEALFRNFLYGNDYFDKNFSKRSVDVYLPDCFGFGYALPSVAAHSNLKGFTTQKLVWSGAYGVPFDIGIWRGPDGGEVFACLDGRDYNASLKKVRKHPCLKLSLRSNTKKYNLPMTLILHGRGDRGGSPREPSVQVALTEHSQNAQSNTDVLIASSDQIYRDIDALTKEQKLNLPVWENELVMTDHAVGGYTSRAIGKRWNRKGEQLALTAERFSMFAECLGVKSYPQKELDTSWKRIIAHQFHDDIPGTSLEICYKRNWNDYMLSINQFAEEYRSSVGAVSSRLDSSFAKGTAVAVSNPLACKNERCQTVEAQIAVSKEVKTVKVFDKNNNEVPSQIINSDGGKLTVAFYAKVPSVGICIYDVRESEEKCKIETDLSVSERRLENNNYIVEFDNNGDIFSVFDKSLKKEVLKAPIRMALQKFDGSITWPAWELDYKEVMKKPIDYARNPTFKILESGPARASIQILRSASGSQFSQIVSLDTDSNIINVFNEIEWRSLRTLLKTEFPLNASSETATYDLGLGVIQRKNNTKNLYEVPAQMWADITDKSGNFGVSILSDSKYGWDKPNDNTLRLTGIYSPRSPFRDAQHMQEFGLNRYSFGIYSHAGSWQNGTQTAGMEFNEPMKTFVVQTHAGSLESSISFCSVSDDEVIIRAIKKAQNSDEIVVRVNEGTGKEKKNIYLSFFAEVLECREIFASEEEKKKSDLELHDSKIRFGLKPFEVKSFAIKLSSGKEGKEKAENQMSEFIVDLPFNADAVSQNGKKEDGAFPDLRSIPAEQFPEKIVSGGVEFKMGGTEDGEKNAVFCNAQGIEIPNGAQKLHIIAASFDADKAATFSIESKTNLKNDCKTISLKIQSATQPIAAWDLYSTGETGYVKTDTLAWNSTHAHKDNADEFGRQIYFFKYTFDLDNDAKQFILPKDENIVVLAATATQNEPCAQAASPLFDRLEPRECTYKISKKEDAAARKTKMGHFRYRMKFLLGYAKRRISVEARKL